jgi:hypothetical protein
MPGVARLVPEEAPEALAARLVELLEGREAPAEAAGAGEQIQGTDG